MATYNAGVVTAYGSAVQGGYTGTYEEFCAQQANYASSAAAVAQAKIDAEAAATAAQTAAASLTVDSAMSNSSTNPVQNKVIYGELSDLKEEISELSGLSDDIKDALLQIAAKVAYIDDDGQDYYDALEDALYPPAELSSISAVYTQSGMVYPTTSLNSLNSDLVVAAHYTDSSSETVTTYTLSGTLSVGTSTITVTYEGKTTTFNVTVTAAPTLSSISAVYTQSSTVYDTDSLDSLKTDLVVTATYSDTTTATVPSTDYTLSGTLTVGTSTITVSYGGKTTTFTVTVSSGSAYTFYDYIKMTSNINSTNQADSGILCDISMSSDYTFETSLYYTYSLPHTQNICGTRSGQSGSKEFGLFITSDSGKLGYWIGTVDTSVQNYPFAKDQINTIKVKPVGSSQTYPSNVVIEVNGTDYNTGATTTGATWDNWLGFFMYAISATGTSQTTTNQRNIGQRIGKTTIKNTNNETLHELIPAYNGTYYGLYDSVEDKFYHKESTYICGNWED